MALSSRAHLVVGMGVGIGLTAAVLAGLLFLTQEKQDSASTLTIPSNPLHDVDAEIAVSNRAPLTSGPTDESSTTPSLPNEDPEIAWRTIVNDKIDDAAQLDLLSRIAKNWSERDGFEVLSQISSSLVDSQKSEMLHSLVGVVVGQKFQEALDYTMSLTLDEQSSLSAAIVQVWSRSDPEAAFDALSEIDESSLKGTLQQIVLDSWAAKEPYALLERVDLLPEELRLMAIDRAVVEIARTTPMDAINRVDAMQSYLTDTSTIDAKIVEIWSDLDPDAALTWVMSKIGSKHQYRGEHLIDVVLQRLVQEDPYQALQVALNQPINSESRPLEAYVLNLITNDGEVETAIGMLPQVREENRVAAYQGIGLSLVRNAESNKVLELAQDLSEPEQKEFFRQVVSVWATFQTQNLFEALEQLPTDDIKSRAATELIVQHNSRPKLTDDQIDSLRALLTEEDAAIVAEAEQIYTQSD